MKAVLNNVTLLMTTICRSSIVFVFTAMSSIFIFMAASPEPAKMDFCLITFRASPILKFLINWLHRMNGVQVVLVRRHPHE
jgi:hypothetical protein